MAATREQKRRQQAALRRAVQIIQAEHPELWKAAYERAKAELTDIHNRPLDG